MYTDGCKRQKLCRIEQTSTAYQGSWLDEVASSGTHNKHYEHQATEANWQREEVPTEKNII